MNGSLTDRSDDTIDDTDLYLAFTSLARTAALEGFPPADRIPALLRESLAGYAEPVPGARERIEEVLVIMLMAWRSSELQTEAARRLALLPKTESLKTEV